MINAFKDEYRFLSNFYPCRLKLGELEFTSTEQAYQFAKCVHDKDKEKMLTLGPGACKSLAKKIEVRPDFHDIKLRLMEYIVREKFKQNPELGSLLVNTGHREIVEGNTWGDVYWGVYKGKGENHLGKILMSIRADLLLEACNTPGD